MSMQLFSDRIVDKIGKVGINGKKIKFDALEASGLINGFVYLFIAEDTGMVQSPDEVGYSKASKMWIRWIRR